MSGYSRRLRMLVALVLSSAIATPAFAQSNKPASVSNKLPPRTIRDLDKKEVKVKPDPPSDVKAQQAIEQYRRFLELESKNEKLRAEAMRRLGDLQVEVDEEARAEEFGGLQVDEAVQLYEGLLAGYPNYERNDVVMYQLARAYEAQAQPEKALVVLDRLVTTYPRSQWVVESQFRRGEILFSSGRYREAEAAYTAVTLPGADSGFFDQGLYKLGWSLFKQSRGEESVAAFLRMLDRVLTENGQLRERESLSRAERELADDAMRAIAITYSDIDGPESLDAALVDRGDPMYAHQLYESLGNLYIEKERYQDAALAFEAFAKRRPESRFAPSLQMRTIEAYSKGGFASLVIEGKQAFVERYAFGSEFWRERTVEDAPEVAAQLKSNQKDLAEYHYALAQKDKKTENYTAAARWYRAMLDSFPQDPEAPATRFTLGEVLFESGRFAEAAREYETTAYDYPLHAKAAAAGYAALVSYQKHEPTLQGESQALWHRQGIESALMFATTFPEHPESARVLTKADEDLFALNEFERVIEVSNQILERTPPVDRKYQRTATTLLAHSLFDRGRYEDAEAAYLRVQGFLAANDPDRANIEERIAASIYKQAEAKRTAGDSGGAVDAFLRVAALAPNAKARTNAEYDAAAILLEGKQWERAAQILEAFRRNNPNSELVPDATRSLAVAYLELGRGTQAAAELERVADRAEEPVEVRRAALWQAAELYEKGASPTNAARLYAGYVKQYPSPLDPAMDARQKLADMAKAQNDVKGRSQWLDEIIRADKSAGASRTDRSKYLAAKATIETADGPVALFNSIKLTMPLDKSLKNKRAAMEKTLSVYGQALDYGVAEVTTQATFGMAELYRQLGADLMSSERPKNLDEDAKEQYDVLLEEQAFPFEEKSIELHETNAQRTGDDVYDQWVQRSFDVLAKLKPARYARTEISEDYVPTLR
jgi:cellulose synthase operon protein C